MTTSRQCSTSPAAFAPAIHESRTGKLALMYQVMAGLSGKANMARTIIGNGTVAIFLKPEKRMTNDSTVFYFRLGGFHANL